MYKAARTIRHALSMQVARAGKRRKDMLMPTFIMERNYVLKGRGYKEALDLDDAILKAQSGLEIEDLEHLLDTAEPLEDDGLRLRPEDSGIDDWTVAEERARGQGYIVEADIDAAEFAERLDATAQRAEGSAHERMETAWRSFYFAPDIPNGVTSEARRLAFDMIEEEARWKIRYEPA